MRHLDTGKWLLSWSHTVEVICPRCSAHGVLKGNPYYKEWSGAFTCLKCTYRARTDTTGWIGPVQAEGRCRCNECGTKWLYASKRYRSSALAKQELWGACPQCHKRGKVRTTIQPQTRDAGLDPYLGLTLALQTETRHGVVWVYNAQQLVELHAFITADVREDYNHGWSFFARLPTWMKAAKNRGDVLKALGRLEKRSISSATV